MPKYTVGPLHSKVGIQRDSTVYHSVHYTDGQWCRFYDNEPRKMGGYKLIEPGTPEIIRTMYSASDVNLLPIQGNIFFLGRYNIVTTITFDYNGDNVTDEIDITPAPNANFNPANIDNLWDFEQFTQSEGPNPGVYIVAQVAPNATNISNQVNGGLFAAPLLPGNIQLEPVTDSSNGGAQVVCSGGIVNVSPVLVAYGNGGIITWSDAGDLTNWNNGTNTLTIANTKVVKGANSRGGVLFWTLDTLILANPTLDTATSQYTFISQVIEPAITVLSPQSIISFNQVFYWVGTDQFYSYSGIVQKVTNTMNTDWFFDNINLSQRAKVWGLVIGHYSEIWWFYPRNLTPGADQQECNAAVIYNVELNVWYDTFVNRSSGLPVSIFPYPVMASSVVGYDGENYPIWMHEYKMDEEKNPTTRYAILSFFETHKIDLWTQDSQNTSLIRNRRIAPDFSQIGPMSVQVNYSNYPYETPTVDGPYTFTPPPLTTGQLPYVDFATQGGLVSFTFQSEVVGGFYQGGKTLFFYNIGDTLK